MKLVKAICLFSLWVTLCGTITAQEEPKPLKHVLLFDWKEDIEASKKEQVLELFRGLVDKVDGFNGLSIEDITKSSGNFDIVLILEFTSEEPLKAYELHPDHIKISEMAPPLLTSFSTFDFYGNF